MELIKILLSVLSLLIAICGFFLTRIYMEFLEVKSSVRRIEVRLLKCRYCDIDPEDLKL